MGIDRWRDVVGQEFLLENQRQPIPDAVFQEQARFQLVEGGAAHGIAILVECARAFCKCRRGDDLAVTLRKRPGAREDVACENGRCAKAQAGDECSVCESQCDASYCFDVRRNECGRPPPRAASSMAETAAESSARGSRSCATPILAVTISDDPDCAAPPDRARP